MGIDAAISGALAISLNGAASPVLATVIILSASVLLGGAILQIFVETCHPDGGSAEALLTFLCLNCKQKCRRLQNCLSGPVRRVVPGRHFTAASQEFCDAHNKISMTFVVFHLDVARECPSGSVAFISVDFQKPVRNFLPSIPFSLALLLKKRVNCLLKFLLL